MKKESIYIDLSKCSEEERKHIVSMLPQSLSSLQYDIYEYNFMLDYEDDEWWVNGTKPPLYKTELTYPEFIKLFEDGEGENNGWIKIESEVDLPKENGVYWTYTVDNNMQLRPKEDFIFNGKFNKYFTHYQPIVKPEPPKF